jgi:hypothetical protein
MLHHRQGSVQRVAIETKRGLLVELPPSDTEEGRIHKKPRWRIAWKRVAILVTALALIITVCTLAVSSWRASILYGFRAARPATWPLTTHEMGCALAARTRRYDQNLPCESPAPGCLVHALVGMDDTVMWNVEHKSSTLGMVMYNETSHWCSAHRQRSRPLSIMIEYVNDYGHKRSKTVYGPEAACLLHHLDLLNGIWVCSM